MKYRINLYSSFSEDTSLNTFIIESDSNLDALFKCQSEAVKFIEDNYGLTEEDMTGSGMMIDNPLMSRDLDYSNEEKEIWFTMQIDKIDK